VSYQVKLARDGLWHRRQEGNGDDHTACGLAIDGAYSSRDHVLDDRLCPVCFTSRERDTGEMKLIEKHALDHSRADQLTERWYGDDEITDEIEPIRPGHEPDRDDGSG
jgi:hypothetical protein